MNTGWHSHLHGTSGALCPVPDVPTVQNFLNTCAGNDLPIFLDVTPVISESPLTPFLTKVSLPNQMSRQTLTFDHMGETPLLPIAGTKMISRLALEIQAGMEL